MFWTRLISSIVLLLIAVPSLLIGGTVLWTVLAAVSFVGVFELYRVRKFERTALGFAGYIGVLAWWVLAVGVSLSKVSGRAAFYLVIRFVLCGGHAFLFVSGAGAYPFGKLAGMVGFYCFLGVGHLRLCGRDVAWQA